MLESVSDDDGDERAQEAPRADGDCGAEVCEWIWAAGHRAGRAALFAWRHRKRLRALDGTAARGSAQQVSDLAAGEIIQRGRTPAAAAERGDVFLFGAVFAGGHRAGAGEALGGVSDDYYDSVVDAFGAV